MHSDISTHAPLAGRDCRLMRRRSCKCHFNPRAPCGARLTPFLRRHENIKSISTHAPLAGRDDAGAERQAGLRLISTHAPLAGRDLSPGKGFGIAVRISTHAPLAGRDRSRPASSRRDGISTHAPLAGRDNKTNERKQEKNKFQPTRPLRGATGTRPKSR